MQPGDAHVLLRSQQHGENSPRAAIRALDCHNLLADEWADCLAEDTKGSSGP
jgi:hypothetical protein